MRLTERHIIKRSDKRFDSIWKLCHLSKDLYNRTLYDKRQAFFEKRFISYQEQDRKFKTENESSYRALSNCIAQQVMRCVDSTFKGFLRKKKKDKRTNIPRYLDKDNGLYPIMFCITKSFKKEIENNYIRIPKTDIKFSTEKKDIKQVRLVPKTDYFVLEVIYNVKNRDLKDDNGLYAAIDLGVDNLATVTSNDGTVFIVNGKPLKSINQYYNKKKSQLQSKLTKQKSSKRINKLGTKRKFKIDDYMHKASAYIVNQIDSRSINTLIVGYNKGWKQDTNLGKKVNQNFVSIPFYRFVSMLKYKCELKGIRFILQEESYTSKASFLDHDKIEKGTFSGKRIKRGLYVSKSGIINADVNGSFNIMRKAVGDDRVYPADRGLAFNPRRISF